MADKIVIELSLDPEISKDGKKKIEKQAEMTGAKAGQKFEKGFQKKTLNLGNALRKSFSGLAGIVAGIGLARTLTEGIRLAGIQEDAVNRLNTALKVSGDFTKQQSLELQVFASELQKVTRFGDEVILNQLALAKSFGATNEQAKQVVATAADLAGALGIDLESATRNVAKTLGGYAGELGEVIPALKALTKEQLQAGAGIDALSKQFAGTAAQRAKTFSGQVDQLGNAFGDTLEELGFFITKNETLLGLLQGGVSVLQDFGGGLKIIRKELLGIGESESDKPIDKVNKKLSGLARQINALVDQQKRLREGVFGFAFKEDLLQADRIQGKIQALRNQRRDALIERAKLFEERKNQNKEEINSENAVTGAILTNQQLIAQARLVNSQTIVQDANTRLEALRELKAREFISEAEFQMQIVELRRMTDEQLAELDRQRRDKAVEAAGDIKGATINAFKDISVSTVQLGKDLQTLALRGFGRSFQQIGAALANGENANQAFVDSVKQTGSEAASAFGDYYIKLGVARIAAGDPGGGAVLAGGLGLKVLAGALGASSGGAGGGAGGGATAFNDQTPALTDTGALQEQDIERAEPQTNVEVVVQGSLVQQDELGTFIAETLSESFGKQGVALTDARIS